MKSCGKSRKKIISIKASFSHPCFVYTVFFCTQQKGFPPPQLCLSSRMWPVLMKYIFNPFPALSEELNLSAQQSSPSSYNQIKGDFERDFTIDDLSWRTHAPTRALPSHAKINFYRDKNRNRKTQTMSTEDWEITSHLTKHCNCVDELLWTC